MRLSLWLVLFTATPIAAHGQQEGGALPRAGVSVEEIMRSIEERTGCFFAFDRRAFDVTRTVQAPPAEAGVEELLTLITDGTDFEWLRNGVYIVIHYSPRRVAPPVVSAPRTSDVYSPSDPNADAFGTRPLQPSEQPVAPPPVVAPPRPIVLPDPFSVYRDPDTYSPIRHALPRFALKTDLLYGAATLTPNIGFEWGLSPRSTVELTWGWNQLNHDGTKKLNHGLGRVEYRRWFCERYNGHFVGAHIFGSKYNIGGYDVPTLFEREYRYEGWAWGAGLTYGYHLALTRRWGVEFQAGVGVVRLDHTRFECVRCGTVVDRSSKVWFGPTRVGVDIVFMLGK